MSLRPRRARTAPAIDPALLALSRPGPVLERDEFGSRCLDVVFDRVRELPEVVTTSVDLRRSRAHRSRPSDCRGAYRALRDEHRALNPPPRPNVAPPPG